MIELSSDAGGVGAVLLVTASLPVGVSGAAAATAPPVPMAAANRQAAMRRRPSRRRGVRPGVESSAMRKPSVG